MSPRTIRVSGLGFVLLVALSVPLAHAQAGPEITNQRVIEMTKLGFGDEIIIAKIKTGTPKFSLSDNDLLALKQAGVSDKVIAAMLEASVLTTARVTVGEEPLELHLLGQSKVGGRLGSMATFGVKSVKVKAYLQGPHASAFGHQYATIVIELPPNDSIENYILVRMDGKEDRRELEMASIGGAVGAKVGVRAEDIVPTSATPRGGNLYHLTPNSRLKRGEYLLYIIGSADTIKGIYGKGYDFSVE